MQVDPIKPTLKAPGTKRLKLHTDEPLSNLAFKCNLRRYIVGDDGTVMLTLSDGSVLAASAGGAVAYAPAAGAYTRPLLTST